jgi:hypothetical protein
LSRFLQVIYVGSDHWKRVERSVMPLNRVLVGQKFEPNHVKILNDAYETALRALYLVDRNDPLTEMVARKVIELGQNGISDPAQIAKIAINSFAAG